jgi:hypothetical protein
MYQQAIHLSQQNIYGYAVAHKTLCVCLFFAGLGQGRGLARVQHNGLFNTVAGSLTYQLSDVKHHQHTIPCNVPSPVLASA